MRRSLQLPTAADLRPQRDALATLRERREAIENELALRAGGDEWAVRLGRAAGSVGEGRWQLVGQIRKVDDCSSAAEAVAQAWPESREGDQFDVSLADGASVPVVIYGGAAIELKRHNGRVIYPGEAR